MTQPTESAPSPATAPSADVVDAIAELEAVLLEEADALSRLDVEGIDAVVERKLQLLPALRGAQTAAADVARLSRVRELAIRNQLLTVHARDTVNSIVGAVVPHSAASYPPTGLHGPRPGFKVSVKG